VDRVAPLDGLAPRTVLLVDHGPVLEQSPVRRGYHEVAGLIHRHVVHAVEVERDLRGISAGRDHEVVFQAALIAVVDEIHARVHVFVAHLVEAIDVALLLGRIVAAELPDAARLRLERPRARCRVAIDQAHVHPTGRRRGRSSMAVACRAGPAQFEGGSTCRYLHALPRTAGEETRVPVAVDAFEGQRKSTQQGLRVGDRRSRWKGRTWMHGPVRRHATGRDQCRN
jgi:hypothetical protein